MELFQKKKITKQATGLPGNIKMGFQFIRPNPKGSSCFNGTFQNFTFPILFIIFTMKSLLPEEAPPETMITSYFLVAEFSSIFLELSFTIPLSNRVI